MDVDPVERLRDEWKLELADLNTDGMVSVARLNRTRALVMRQLTGALAESGSSMADFDVLSTLRRQGPPYRMKPSDIARQVMLSASGMTNRIDQLEQAGFVERIPDPTNRRIVPVALTERGVIEAERLAREIAGSEEQIMSNLTSKERAALDKILAKLATSLQ